LDGAAKLRSEVVALFATGGPVMKILIVGAGAMGKLRGISTPLHEAVTELIHLLEKWGAGREI
jgi:ketopantoate reductase